MITSTIGSLYQKNKLPIKEISYLHKINLSYLNFF